MNRSFIAALALLIVLASSTTVIAAARLIGITGNQGPPHDPADEKLFEVNLSNASLTALIKLPFVPDTDAIGFNPENSLLYRVSGAESYSNNPSSNGYRDNQFMETVDVNSPGFPQVGIFNANAPGNQNGPFGLPAPRPGWVLPVEPRTDAQTGQEFRIRGPNEYHALRDITWSSDEHLFYGTDETGIYRLTPAGESTFVGFPAGFPGGPKGITFFDVGGERRLLVTERDGPSMWTIDPQTGLTIGNPVTLFDVTQTFLRGVLSLVENPDDRMLYGLTNKPDSFGLGRELIRIDPITGATTSLGVFNTHIADLAFVTTPVPLIHTWNVDASGNWSVASNWTNGEPNGAGTTANFLGAITAPRTVNIDGPRTVGNLTFDNANSYTLGGVGPLAIDNGGAATIDVLSGSHTISAPLSIAAGNTATKSGPGTLTISGPQSHGASALLIASGGTTNVNSDAGANLSVQANAAVNFGSTQHLGGLQIGDGAAVRLTAGGNKALVTPTLTIAGTASIPTGGLDLSNNTAIVDYSGASPAANIRLQILAGRGGPGFGAPWNGTGITSSAAAAANAVEPESRSLGFANNAELPLGAYSVFRGQTVDGTSVLVAYTRTADANLDGVVNDDDVTIVGATYAPGVPNPFWALGDFDYNGSVDDDDVTLLGAFYNPSAPPLVAPAPDAAASVAAIPEPASIMLLAFGLFALAVFMRGKNRA